MSPIGYLLCENVEGKLGLHIASHSAFLLPVVAGGWSDLHGDLWCSYAEIENERLKRSADDLAIIAVCVRHRSRFLQQVIDVRSSSVHMDRLFDSCEVLKSRPATREWLHLGYDVADSWFQNPYRFIQTVVPADDFNKYGFINSYDVAETVARERNSQLDYCERYFVFQFLERISSRLSSNEVMKNLST